MLALLGALFVWSYWPVLAQLFSQWSNVPDYSHGFLVIPLALFFLWQTRQSVPRFQPRLAWPGLLLVAAAAAIRTAGSWFYLDALQGWSIPLWVAGFVWTFFGWPVLKWALPAIAFLIFMVPIPYTLETMLGQPLQRISTEISLFVLQCLGQPAIAEGTTIQLGENKLEVARACSGLRIFFGIAALAFAFMVLFKRPLWMKLLLAMAVLPVALLANSLRIVVTGLLYQQGMGEAANQLSHDFAGWFMIPVAVALFALTLGYLDRLLPVVQTVGAADLVKGQARGRAH